MVEYPTVEEAFMFDYELKTWTRYYKNQITNQTRSVLLDYDFRMLHIPKLH
jgi:hypothetical protein